MSFGAEDLPRHLCPPAPLLTSCVPLSCLRGPVWEVGTCPLLREGPAHTHTVQGQPGSCLSEPKVSQDSAKVNLGRPG